MELRCPQCAAELEVEQIRIGARIQCPACGSVFRADEGAPRATFQSDEIIDVNAEVLFPGTEEGEQERFNGPRERVVRDAAPIHETADTQTSTVSLGTASKSRPVYFRKVVVQRNEGCGCGGCGCLVLLFLLFLFLFGCAAIVTP